MANARPPLGANMQDARNGQLEKFGQALKAPSIPSAPALASSDESSVGAQKKEGDPVGDGGSCCSSKLCTKKISQGRKTEETRTHQAEVRSVYEEIVEADVERAGSEEN